MVVVGLGAAGGIAAHVLTQLGRCVHAIEAGPFLSSDDFIQDELQSSQYENHLGRKFNLERPMWQSERDGPKVPGPTSPMGRMVNGVGGSSVVFAAWSRRLQPEDFCSLTSVREAHCDHAIPKECTLVDWPLKYEDLEPYYSAVERLIGVSGVANRVDGREAGPLGNPFEGVRSTEYPLPPLRSFRYGEMFSEAARKLGYHPYQPPVAILSESYDGRPGCVYCSWCFGCGCAFGSKGSSLVTAIPKALATGRLKISTGLRVVRILRQGSRAIGVACVGIHGEEVTVLARTVILAAYTFENVRLLLLSRGLTHEHGLGNEHGQVGKNFMARPVVEVLGHFPGPRLERANGPSGQAVCIDDFASHNFDHRALGFIGGGTITVENELQPIRAASYIPPWVPRWGSKYKRFVVQQWDQVGPVRAFLEALPYEGNEIDLDWGCTDDTSLKLPRALIRYSFRQNERRLANFIRQRMLAIVRKMGAATVWQSDVPDSVLTGHDLGGARMGTDPAGSVVDNYGRVHEMENLFVLGGATFPTATSVNPTLTIQALAWRTAEHIARNPS